MSSYLLKISLRGTPHLIWRRFVVPSFTTLGQLHGIVQKVMGWQDRCPHTFSLRKQSYCSSKMKEIDGLPEEMFSLDDIAYQAGVRLKYIYDPNGDKWVHEIAVENVRYLNPNGSSPIYCLDGIRACPPESCGGVAGFVEMQKILKNPKHPQHQQYVDQYGMLQFDRFDLDGVNKSLNAKTPVESEWNAIVRMTGKAAQKKEKTKLSQESIDPLYRLGQALRKKAAS